MYNYDGYAMMHASPWAGLFSFILLIVVLAAIAAGVIMMLRHMPHAHITSLGGPGDLSALDLLNQRYAKGEISQEEYRTIKKDIA